ncbi:MAG: carbohydrate-binding family 9-like protein [Bryobacterales bacterium]|nr:carbohydrate-binding family 9-like protein [Bryobacterales bacterium]
MAKLLNVSVLTLSAALPIMADPGARMEAQRTKDDFELRVEAKQWRKARAVAASVDPFGKPAGAGNQFEIKALWTPANLYFLFTCPYSELVLKPNPTTAEETNKLWEWDVAEVFIAGDRENVYKYRELQVSPQGEWVDLDIDRKNSRAAGGWKWNSGFEVKAKIDRDKKVWYGAMKIPFSSIGGKPGEAGAEFPINIYRLTGENANRKSTMWTPTQNRSHHTPEMFGRMILAK